MGKQLNSLDLAEIFFMISSLLNIRHETIKPQAG